MDAKVVSGYAIVIHHDGEEYRARRVVCSGEPDMAGKFPVGCNLTVYNYLGNGEIILDTITNDTTRKY
jgi:hypothetical protein